MGGNLGNSLHGGKPLHDRGRLGGCDQEIEVAHRLHAPAQAAGGLHALDLGEALEAGQDAVRNLSGLPPEVAGGIGLAILDPGKDFLLGLLAKALELGHLSFVTGLGKRLDRIDVQLFVQGLDLFTAQAGHLQQIKQAGGDGGDQVVVELEFTRGEEGLDLFREGLADTRDVPKALFLDDRTEVLLHGLEGPGARKIGPYLEGVLPLDLHHGADSLQNLYDILLIHCLHLESFRQRDRRKSGFRGFCESASS